MKEIIETDQKTIGPYSVAVRAGDLIFVSGQLPIDPGTGTLDGDGILSQARRSMENLRVVLASAGYGMDRIIKVNAFLSDLDDFAAFNEVYAEYFGDVYPARSAVQVARLPRDAKIEIEAVAYCG